MTDEIAEPGSIAVSGAERRLGRAEFHGLGEMPPELEWFANLDNPPHPARLPQRREGVHRFRRRRAPRGDAASHPRPPDRLARRTSSAARLPRAPSGENSPRSPRSLTTFARSTPSATTRFVGSNAPKRKATRARPRRSRDGQARALLE